MFFDSLKALSNHSGPDRQVQSTKSLKQVTWSQASFFFSHGIGYGEKNIRCLWKKYEQVVFSLAF